MHTSVGGSQWRRPCAEDAATQRARLAKCAARLHNLHVSSAYNAWSEATRERRRMRALASRVVVGGRRCKLNSSSDPWLKRCYCFNLLKILS